ncbi:valine--tRNA ligase [Sphingobacterium cellulitidis]|uniref:Valine--tRNA ligase n=1 Tax=Sphingobacterium cellulitidis TaxID=1768011 RepID=A0A8H9KWV3_9SPHI|nr:valine--tRNA ligase [Sphingobacterium soli]MBA8988192.1 valyl-tRNA synthetase [Sphingobacterium soli]OYD43159.1 valine--tRNA ligase [Sphingobacterium cellulitidis]GGE30577.1 valine--tRNA ligase [Sphingobacterium soli]
MSIAKTYNPKEAEEKWYSYWMSNGFFRSVPDEREPYTIVMPPPNVTGVLHMGHMLNNTIQDVLIRRARMQGKNACWVPGTDHASIATEAKVVAMLKEKGIEKSSITREEFLSYAWEWKEKYGGIILKQLEKLGASCDWERTKFTMDPDLSEAVIDTFIKFYKEGYIYRGIRMVNWDPEGKTALSDEEVIRKEVNQKLYYVRYKIKDSDEYVIIATTRPETIMADTAICINPADERYKHLQGKTVLVPLINREIPIIQDEYVEMEFGTGCLKVTPAHDLNDYELGQKHNLEVIDILNDNGTLNEKAQILVGEDRFIARKKVAVLLEEAGQIEKIEDYKSQVGFSERTNAAIEPKLSMQWFLKMDTLAKPALEYVEDGTIKLIPDKFFASYKHWMENVKDWCISRQLWWGQRIPAWYNEKNEWVIAKTEAEAIQEFESLGKSTSGIRQEDDVLDTWFSSGLWPMSVFDGVRNPENPDFKYYYPTNDLVTAPEILFFWVARMIIMGHDYTQKPPFRNVYLTGIVRDKLGRKMSKSLGNSPDPIELMELYGTDGVRVGMLLSSPAGNDLMFDVSYCEQGRNFANKIWNAFRLVKGWEVVDKEATDSQKMSAKWFEARFNQTLVEIEEHFANYRLSDALMATYKLIWDDFCSWYLELVKPAYQAPIEKETYETVKGLFQKVLKLAHPFMPFITEELWHDEIFGERDEKDCIIVAEFPKSQGFDENIIKEFSIVQQIISEVRNIRNSKGLSPKIALPLAINATNIDYSIYQDSIKKLANVEELTFVKEKVTGAVSFLAGKDECYVALENNIDVDAEKERITKEIEYLKGFLVSVDKKLSNERFVQNAKPEIVENEKNKKADAEAKIQILVESLNSLG